MGRPRRLLIVADAIAGGLGAVVAQEADWFRERGWDVSVAAPSDRGHPSHSDDLVVQIPEGARDLVAAFAASRILRRHRATFAPHAVHCHGARAFLIATLAGVRRPVVTHHGFGRDPREGAAYYRLRSMAMRVIPPLSAKAFSGTLDVPGSWRFEPLRSPSLDRLDHDLPLAEGGLPTFAWIGRLAPPKQPEMFIRAVASLNREVPVRGLLAGDGPARPSLEVLASAIRAPVEFLGWTAVEGVLERSRATVLTSQFEAVSFAVQEAMWCGRPTVVSPLPSLKWLCGAEGLFARTDDELEAHMARLLDDDVSMRLGDAASRRVRCLMDGPTAWELVERVLVEEAA